MPRVAQDGRLAACKLVACQKCSDLPEGLARRGRVANSGGKGDSSVDYRERPNPDALQWCLSTIAACLDFPSEFQLIC